MTKVLGFRAKGSNRYFKRNMILVNPNHCKWMVYRHTTHANSKFMLIHLLPIQFTNSSSPEINGDPNFNYSFPPYQGPAIVVAKLLT